IDAYLLKFELRYGVPMTVPLAGRIAVWIMRIADGCVAPSGVKLGTVDLGMPEPLAAPRAWACPFYLAPDASGNPVPRWPVRVAATIRMQSPARRSAATPARTQSAVRGASSTGRGASTPEGLFAVRSGSPSDTWTSSPGGDRARSDFAAAARPAASDDGRGLAHSGTGWLQIGGERTFSVPGACS